MTTKAETKRNEQAEALAQLREVLMPGDTVYTILRKVSSTGMNRQISLFVIKDNKMVRLSHLVARALDYKLTDKNPGRNWAIRIGGCGMDMGFHLVYGLSRVAFANIPDPERKDPGYLLNHRWL
jgi:hypothetical protein